MSLKTALITGGAGFIGSHIVDLLLKKKIKVFLVDDLSGGHLKNIKNHLKNKKLKFIRKNINDLDIKNIGSKKIDYFFHLAGKGDIVPSIEHPEIYFETNVNGTLKMLQLARKLKVKKFLYAASSSCYGLASVPTKENHILDPKYPYALSKLMGEQLCTHWSKVYNLPIISIRIFNAYGPRVRTTGAYGAVFGVFFKQKLSNKPFTLVGNGKQKRDFLFVNDIAEAFYLCAKSKIKNKIYNLGAGLPQSIIKLIKLIGGDYINIPKRPGEPECTWADISKIKKDIKWKPKVKFEDGVREMIKNIDHWSDAPLWNVKNINKATKNWFKYLK